MKARLMPALISTLFDVAARRRDQLKALESMTAELRDEYEAAIAAGADDQADKIAGKMMRTKAEAGATRMAIETAERQARERAADAARIEQERRVQAHAEAGARYEGEALRFEEQAAELLAQWHVVRERGEAVRARAIEAGVEFGCEPPSLIWNSVFIRFLQGTQIDDRPQMVMPLGRSPSRELETLAQRFSRRRTEPRAAAAPQEVN